MPCKSFIDMFNDKVKNLKAYKTANKHYYQAFILPENGGDAKAALFTEAEIAKAVKRAEKNREDLKTQFKPGLLCKIFGCLVGK